MCFCFLSICWFYVGQDLLLEKALVYEGDLTARVKTCSKTLLPKIMAPQTMDQSDGEKVCGPDQIDVTNTKRKEIVGLMEKISSRLVSAQVKIEVMHRAMATCPKINMGCGRKVISSLLDSGSHVTLIHQSFFKQEILPHIKPADGEKAKAHQLFQLTAANNGKLPVSMYVELDLDFLGIVVPKVGVLITQELNELLETYHKTKLPGVDG